MDEKSGLVSDPIFYLVIGTEILLLWSIEMEVAGAPSDATRLKRLKPEFSRIWKLLYSRAHARASSDK